MGIQINGQTDTISSTDGSLNIGGTVTVNVTGDATGLTGTPNITVGVVTASSAIISGDLTVNGTTTTLDTTLTEVDKLEVGANNTTVGVAITQSGTGDILRLYDSSTQVVTVKDGGSVGIGTDNPDGQLTIRKQILATDTITNSVSHLSLISNLGGSNAHQSVIHFGPRNASTNTSPAAISAIASGNTASDLAFYVNTNSNYSSTPNTEALRITNTGNIGIGTDNPIMRLHVHGAANSADSRIRLSSAEGSGLTIRAQSATENNINADSGEDITFSRGNVESLRINSNGTVGINTTADIRQLEIYNSSHATAALKSDTQSSLFFSDDDTNIGQISYMHSGNYMYFRVNDAERLRIESGGTLFSKSPSDATPNFKFISDDTNWHGYLNQTVHGGTISSILSCGGTWTVDGTTYNATKDYNGSFGTAALIVHNQYNSTATGGELVFVTKANGSTTTDGAVTERFRITSDGDVGIGMQPRRKLSVRTTSTYGDMDIGSQTTTSGRIQPVSNNTWYDLPTDSVSFGTYTLVAGFIQVAMENNEGDGNNRAACFWIGSGNAYASYGTQDAVRIAGSTSIECQAYWTGSQGRIRIRTTTGASGNTNTDLFFTFMRLGG